MLYEWGKRELARYQHSDQSAQNPEGAIHKGKSDDLLNRTKLVLFAHASLI